MEGRGWSSTPDKGSVPPTENGLQPDSPFEEPEQAPELRADRSENLYSRDEPFWNRVVDEPQPGQPVRRDPNYWNHPDRLADDGMHYVNTQTSMQKLRSFLGSGTVKKFFAVLAVVVVVAVILYSLVFRVHTITVVGNSAIPAAEITRLSGLRIGQNSVTIDDEEVMRRIESNRYLRCSLVDVQWNSVTIHVREREPAVYINHNGMVVLLDNRGYALEEYLTTEQNFDHLVKVIGLNVHRCALGQQINLNSSTQLQTYTQILVELKAMKGIELLHELDMTNMDSIYLATRDGFYVRLGSESGIHEKLRAFMITREEVLRMGYVSGTIDVTDPGRPTYSP